MCSLLISVNIYILCVYKNINCVDITARFNPENYTETEGSSVNLTVVLDKPPAKDVTVIITTMEITATRKY